MSRRSIWTRASPCGTRRSSCDAVSRTGVTVDGDTAFLGDNAGHVYAVAVATGEIRWTADAGGFLTTPPAVSNDLVIVAVQGDRSYASEARRVPRVRRFARLERRDPGRSDLRVVTRDRRRSGRGGVLGQDGAGVRAVRWGGSLVGPAQQPDVLHGCRGADLGRGRGRRRSRAGLPVGPGHRRPGVGLRGERAGDPEPGGHRRRERAGRHLERAPRGDRPRVGAARVAERAGQRAAAEPGARAAGRGGRQGRGRARTRRVRSRSCRHARVARLAHRGRPSEAVPRLPRRGGSSGPARGPGGALVAHPDGSRLPGRRGRRSELAGEGLGGADG